MRETAKFLLSIKNLTTSSCSPTPNFGDSAINMGQIAYFSLRMRKTFIFLLRVKNLTSPSCSPTPISYNTRNFGDTWTFKADIAFFIFALIFRTSGPKMVIFRGKIEEGVGRYWPQRTRSYFWGSTPLCQIWWKSTKKCDRESDDTRTDRQTDANRFYYLPHAICYSYGADNKHFACVLLLLNQTQRISFDPDDVGVDGKTREMSTGAYVVIWGSCTGVVHRCCAQVLCTLFWEQCTPN